ncbi:hypothetical protein CBI42_10915 [Streptococcus sp. KR]|uniref:hypothetical protein n=1 Tax=Streptococcus sp. KR TaxID=1979528 RepID=UPI000B9A2235|nr:hypothetical protein [Streptococcus sp. KR]OXT10192.1 hypothetical protein CBI42_10915 [Streptococcus sp. KR]
MIRKNKSLALKQKRTSKHSRGNKEYLLLETRKYDTKTDSLFDTNKKYRIFSILGGISYSVLSVLVPINLFLAFVASVTTKIFNSHFSQIVGVGNASFMSVFKILYLNNVEFMRMVFVVMALALTVVFFSSYSMRKIEKMAQ